MPVAEGQLKIWGHTIQICYKYTCLESEGDKAEKVLYTAGIGLEAERHNERERERVRPAGQAGRRSGASNSCLVGAPAGRGVLSRAFTPGRPGDSLA